LTASIYDRSVTSGAGPTSLVGRERELQLLDDAVAAAGNGRGRVVLLEGEPGIGKTRLVTAACERAGSAGLAIYAGDCDDLVAPRPFAALLSAFDIVSDAADPDRGAIASLVDAHADSDGAAVGRTANPGLQYRVTEALGALVEKLATRGPLVIALDDVQWADASTLIALRSISRRVQTLPVALLVSGRSGHDNAELHKVTDDLLRAGASRMAIGPLDDESVTLLVTDMLADQPSARLLDRARGASGNPLFVIEYVRSVQSTEGLDNPSTTPLEFRLTVLRRLSAFPEESQHALRLAAILGESFSPADLAVVTGRRVVELMAALHPAVTTSIIEDRGERVAFRHALIRDAIYEHVPLALRRELHREAGRALAGASADARIVAHHLSLAAAGEDLEAVEWIRRAARDTAAKAPGIAVELLERAQQLLGPASQVRDEVHADLAVALAWSGRLAEAEALSAEVLARRPDARLAGSLRCGLVYALTWQGKAREALRHTTPAADENLSEMDAVLLRAEEAVASMWAFDLKTASKLAAETVEQARKIGHDLAHCHALTVRAHAATFAGRPHDAVALAREAVELADRSPTGEAHLAHPRFFPGMPLLFLDELDEAEATLRTGLQLAQSLGLAWSLPLYHAMLGAKGFIAGDWDSAIAECDAAMSVADDVGLHVGIIAAASAWLATIQLHRDDLEGAERTLATALARLAETGPQFGMGPFNCARALVLEARNQNDEALALLQASWDLFSAGAPMTDGSPEARVTTDPWSAMAMVRLCVATGDVPRAAALLPSIEHQSAATGTPFMRGQALRCRGLVEQDADTLVRAVALYRKCPRPNELAAACEDAARLLAAAGRLDEAVPHWDEAVELYERLGADRDVALVRAELREHGIRRGTRRPNVRATSGWESLTDAEHKVVALVAQGLSNPEVAERLFVSRYTVESHLKNTYRKLGLSSRVELAATAAGHGSPNT
jgi:DNA-binding CsgD family transcriptional regulator